MQSEPAKDAGGASSVKQPKEVPFSTSMFSSSTDQTHLCIK